MGLLPSGNRIDLRGLNINKFEFIIFLIFSFGHDCNYPN